MSRAAALLLITASLVLAPVAGCSTPTQYVGLWTGTISLTASGAWDASDQTGTEMLSLRCNLAASAVLFTESYAVTSSAGDVTTTGAIDGSEMLTSKQVADSCRIYTDDTNNEWAIGIANPANPPITGTFTTTVAGMTPSAFTASWIGADYWDLAAVPFGTSGTGVQTTLAGTQSFQPPTGTGTIVLTWSVSTTK